MTDKLKEIIITKYNQDKLWCIEYHNKGDINMYNLIYGRIMSYAVIDNEMKLELNLIDDMEKNIPLNRKMIAGYYDEKIISYSNDDIINLMEKK